MGTPPKTAIPSAILDLLFGPVMFSDFSTSIAPSSSLCATFLYPDKLRSVHRFIWAYRRQTTEVTASGLVTTSRPASANLRMAVIRAQCAAWPAESGYRSEEHTSELQSR